MFDIPGQIRKAINEFLLWVAKTGLKPVMNALGSTALSTPDITGNPQVKAVWTTSLIVANGIYVLFVVLGGFILASRETLQSQYGFKQIAPRLAVGAVVSNISLILCGKAIEATNALTAAIAGQGVDGPDAAQAISGILDQPLTGTSPNILLILLVIAVAVLGLVVVITFILRVALLVLLFGIAPLAMVCHASPQTEGIAYTWWRAFFACLGLQVAQAVIVVGTVKVFLTPSGLVLLGVPATTSGLLGVLVCVTMLWLLIKVPGLMKQFVLAPIGMQSQGRGLVGQLIQAFVMIKTLGAAAGLTGAATAGSRTARAQPAARQRAATSGTRTARPAPAPGGRGARPATPRPALPRPSPTGPVAFSNAPTTQTPLAVPAGTNGAPAFSHPAQPGTPAPAPTGSAPAAPFSHASPAQPPSSRPVAGPTPVAFSGAPPTPASPTPPGPAPASTFSATERPQSAPRRPPAPVTPVFSSAPPTPKTRPTAARRAARPSSAGGPPPVTGTPASPGPASTARRSPRPAPPSPPPAASSPPPARRRPRGDK
ncbi:hypothetical protein [Actinoplanes sp. NBRC 103695]|uniref:hypothetical protein n=1 Tax=Actinoplanes sp. NBRC 103695 TaxID=3032202 RepID=UPI00255617C5|nr:hypothetical protein [Actinoplanes sp. NBRC 103695]